VIFCGLWTVPQFPSATPVTRRPKAFARYDLQSERFFACIRGEVG
jgi:hypothetical protein